MMEHVIAWICLIWMNILYIWTDDSCMRSVSQCPLTQSEWMARSMSFNCSTAPEILNYTCIFNARDELVETCTTNYPILPRYDGCPVVTSCRRQQAIVGERKLYRECPYNVTGCPQQNHERYSVNELYKYPACIVYNYTDLTTSTISSTVLDLGTTESTSVADISCTRCKVVRWLIALGVIITIVSHALVFAFVWRRRPMEPKIELPVSDERQSFIDGHQESAALCEEYGDLKNVRTCGLYFPDIPTDGKINEKMESIFEKPKRKSVVQHQRGLEEAISRLRDKRTLVITGREGCWKKSFAVDLINKLLDEKIVSKAALIESKQDWNAFLQLTGSKCAYLKSEEMVQTRDWLSFSNEYNSEEIFLIIVHGVEVYDIKHYEDNFDSIINLAFSEFELSMDERKIAITDACRLKNHEIDETIETAVEIETKEGFLETLNEYFSNTAISRKCTLSDYFSKIVPRLEQPNAIYLSTTAKHDLEFFLLAFCYLCASDIDISVLYNPNNKDNIHRFVNLEGHERMSSYEEIASTRHKLMKYNLRTGKTDMLAMYGEKYPQYYIEYSVNSEFFIEHTGSETSNVQKYVMIPKIYWYKFVQRLVDMLGKEKCRAYLEYNDPDLIPYITTEFPPEKERFHLVDDSRDM